MKILEVLIRKICNCMWWWKLTYYDDHFTIYTYVKSVLYTWNEYNVIYKLYLNLINKWVLVFVSK